MLALLTIGAIAVLVIGALTWDWDLDLFLGD